MWGINRDVVVLSEREGMWIGDDLVDVEDGCALKLESVGLVGEWL